MDFVELFAGIGLFRRGLEAAPGNWTCLMANDFSPSKAAIYRAQYGAGDLIERDIMAVTSADIPGHPDLVTGSFPCQDLSLAGNRAGLAGARSGLAHRFFAVISQLQAEDRAPEFIVLENVTGLLTSHEGADVRVLLQEMNLRGYAVDLLLLDAVHWLPQSRPRVFVIGRQVPGGPLPAMVEHHPARPLGIMNVLRANADLNWALMTLPDFPAGRAVQLVDIIEDDPGGWFPQAALERELGYIMNSPQSAVRLQRALATANLTGEPVRMTGYRRMRRNETNLELRDDGVAGCLRTANGGSSRQLLVEARPNGDVGVRFMTPNEYAALMGINLGDWVWAEQPTNKHLTGFGDAVAVPVITWLGRALQMNAAQNAAQEHLVPALAETL